MKLDKFLIGLVLITLFSMIACAGMSPQPVGGKVTLEGYPILEGLDLEQKNLRTGVINTVQLDAHGYFLYDWGNSLFLNGDNVEITVKICKDNSACKRIVTLYDGKPCPLVNIFVPSNFEVITQETIKVICYDGSEVSDVTDCPIPSKQIITNEDTLQDTVEEVIKEVLKTSETTKYYCLDGSLADSPEDCEEENSSWLYWLFGLMTFVLSVIFGKGGHKWYNGKYKHYHRGIKNYHDPNTTHSNPKYRHTSWKESAWRCLKEVDEIQKGIDLSTK